MPNSLILLSCFLLLSSTASAFNITRLLERYPNYGTFNSLLNQTELAKAINSRSTITVLAIQDGDIGDLAGKPSDVQKAILSSHVILDYYDMAKLSGLKKGTTLTTLFQTTGVAQNKQGFLNVSTLPDGNVAFGSAMKGGVDVILKEAVAAQPYNISVLRVSGPIVAPGLDPSMATGGSKQPVALPPGPLHKDAPPPKDDADAPASDDEVVAEAPDAESPADSPAESPADAPTADAPDADAPTTEDVADKENTGKSSAGKTIVSGAGLLVVLVGSFLAAF